MKKLTDESIDTIVSILVNEKIEAEENNKNGINNEYLKSINTALEELKVIVKERSMNGENPTCLIHAMRIGTAKDYRIPFDDNIIYGKIEGKGYLVHVSELELPEEN